MNIETPKLAVDVVCYHPSMEQIVLIERKYPPLGWALPGGFVDVGESVEDAARREMREEINLSLKTLQLIGVYSDPARDPRRHVVSVAFGAIISGSPIAGDDAKNIRMVSLRELPSLYLCFDHARIITDARVKNIIP